MRERLAAALADRYRVVRELGRGGMAVVWLADDLRHDRPVAIKVMSPDIAHDAGDERFLREIEIAAKLSHPHILPVHDSGRADGLLYFVMPFVEGDTLRSRLEREGPLPLQEAVRITSEVADALDFAHRRGLVHRDVKPENILFQAGHAMVTDFGIARAVEGRDATTLTKTGAAIGTFRYMSPEQATGEADLDGRSDVYALGCLAYEMLTGAPPFADASAASVLARKLTEAPPPPSAVHAGIPPTVDEVVGRALERDRWARYETPGALSTALSGAVTAEAVARAAVRRRRVGRVRVGAAALAVAAVAGTAWWAIGLLSAPRFERIAVLPITARDDPDAEFLAEGLHTDLVQELSRAGIRVINPGSVRRYRGTDLAPEEIARELGVDAVVEGIASFAGDAISLDLTMTDGASSEIVWLDSFGAEVRDVRTMYATVTRAMMDAMGLRATSDAEQVLAAQADVDPEIQKILWNAQFHANKLSREGLALARDNYRHVLDLDADNMQALVGMANTWAGEAQMGLRSRADADALSEPYLQRATAIDTTNAAVLQRRAGTRTWRDWDWAAADDTFERLLRADPTNSVGRALHSHLLHYLRRDEEATAAITRALELDPFEPRVRTYYGMDLMYMRDYPRADSVLRAVLADEPGYVMALTTLRSVYHLSGDHGRAMEMWRTSNAGDPEALAALDEGYAAGGYEQALRSLAALLEARADTTYVPPWQIGTLYTRAGDVEPALDYLEQAFEAGDGNIPYVSVDPVFDVLKGEPRFQAMLERLGLAG